MSLWDTDVKRFCEMDMLYVRMITTARLFFDTISNTEISGLFYCRKVNGELNLMNAFGETMFADNDECRLIYISAIYQNRYVVVIYANRNNGKKI